MLDVWKAVLFDLDGVLIDSEPVHYAAEIAVLGRYGLELDRPLWESLKGTTAADFFRILRENGVDAPVGDEVLAAETREELLRLLPEMGRPFPGAVELVRSLAGVPLALVTSSARSFADVALDLLSLRDRFSVVVAGEDVERGKPAPDPYRLAAERLGVLPQECVVIEDSLHGVRSALDAGASCIAVAHSFPAAELGHANVVLPTIADVGRSLAARLQSAPRVARK